MTFDLAYRMASCRVTEKQAVQFPQSSALSEWATNNGSSLSTQWIRLELTTNFTAAYRNTQNIFVSQKRSLPLKRYAMFSLTVNLYNWKFACLLPKHISTFTPILVHLSEYLYELYHFY